MKELSRTKRKLLYALLSSSFLWQLPADSYTSETPSVLAIAASPEAEDSDREFDLPGVEVTAVKDRHDQGYMAKRSQIGTKTDTALHETARSISVISREQMEARGVTDLFDALSYTPGFSDATYNRDSRFFRGSLRGFSNDYTTYTDGLRMLWGQFAVPNYDSYSFGRIEVLRGICKKTISKATLIPTRIATFPAIAYMATPESVFFTVTDSHIAAYNLDIKNSCMTYVIQLHE